MNKNTIKIRENGNIVIRDARNGDIIINTNESADISHKLQQLNDA